MPDSVPTRRRFLDYFLKATTLAWIGTVAYPILRYVKPASAPGQGGPLTLGVDDVAKLASDKFVIVRVAQHRVIVFEDGAQAVRALDARCTHEGCTVKFIPAEQFISCACHQGRFDLDGTVLAGPPPRPLKKWSVQRGADDTITIGTQTA